METGLRIIVIDDNPDWCNTLKRLVSGLNHSLEMANTPDEGQKKLADAEASNQLYTIAIIDMNFKEGDTDILAGIDLVDHIKLKYPYVACIIASGERVAPDYVLDLRDERGIDYYLQKDRISKDKIRKAIERSIERLEPVWRNHGIIMSSQSVNSARNLVISTTPTPEPISAPKPTKELSEEAQEEIAHNQALVKEFQKRLRFLEVQAAQFGLQVPPHIQIEADVITDKINTCKRLIAALSE